ncbi:hypothetical protein [Liquorilactobacillus mali]|uniref:hypothetical protein n=1 Tax=Liquorilactobacillus mali TaxID=1618 RepID=UPI0039EBCB23
MKSFKFFIITTFSFLAFSILYINNPNNTSAKSLNITTNTQEFKPNNMRKADGGWAKLYHTRHNILYWAIKVNNETLFDFSGIITIYYNNGKISARKINVLGFAGETSGEIAFNQKPGGNAVLSGKATSVTGTKDYVVPGVNAAF